MTQTPVGIAHKRQRLAERLANYPSLAVACSGGVDSTFLAAFAHEVLGDRLVAVTAESPVHPASELDSARRVMAERGIRHLTIASDEMTLPDFVSNPPERCYICKKRVMALIRERVLGLGISHVAHGANADDLHDYRPGLEAAKELGILAPLVDADMGKDDIRRLSREMDLPTWNKPAMACLASRIPYGEVITVDRLKIIEEAEKRVRDLGITNCRVRYHGAVARIEVPVDEIPLIMQEAMRSHLVREFRKLGFRHVSIDLEGYVQGSLNRHLPSRDR